MVIPPDVEDTANGIIKTIMLRTPTYKIIAAPNGFEPYVPGIMNYLEGNLSMSTHLANGDPLSDDTIHEPIGIMAKYRPDLQKPFGFIQAGQVAMLDFKTGWGSFGDLSTIWGVVDFFAKFNGLGPFEQPGPPQLAYLFSGSSAYTGGKYNEAIDPVTGKDVVTWNAGEVSKQIGAVVLMRCIGVL
jgi:lysozyme family protein